MKILQLQNYRAAIILLFISIFATGLIDCYSQKKPEIKGTKAEKGSVGIINYLEIQNRVGISDQNRKKLLAFDQARDKTLADLLASLREKSKPLETQISKSGDKKKVEESRNKIKELNLLYSKAQQEWAQKRDNYVRSMGNAINRALQPAMQAVCDRHGFKIIMVRSSKEAYVSPDVEMTDEVVDEWKRNPVNPIYDDSTSETNKFPKIGK